MRETQGSDTSRRQKLDFLSMVTGWRRVFCTSIPKRDHHHNHDSTTPTNHTTTNTTTATTATSSPRISSKLKFFSNPSTPRLHTPPLSSPTLRCRTAATTPTCSTPSSPKPLQCKTNQTPHKPSSPRLFNFSKATTFNSSQRNNVDDTKKIKNLRVYNDDEPLMSPSPGSHFNPIPELDENHEISDNFSLRPNIKHLEVTLLPESAIVAVGRNHETHVVVMRLKAPPPYPAARRPPVDLIAVIDVSERMCGFRERLMKRAMRLVISCLNSKDRLSIVVFAGNSKRLLPLRRMTADGRRSARRIVDALGSGAHGLMSVNDALKKAAKVVEDRRERNPVTSILIISNGQEIRSHFSAFNHSRSSSPLLSSTRFSYMDIPVHSLAFHDTNASKHALDDSLAKCVNGVLNVVVQEVRVEIGFEPGSAPAEIVAVYPLVDDRIVLKSTSIRIGDLNAEEEREVLVELKVPTSSIGSIRVLSIFSTFKEPLLQDLMLSNEVALLVPRAQAARPTVPKIVRLRNLHVGKRAVVESRRLTEHRDLSGAYHLLTSARALLMQSNDGSAGEYVRGLEAELAELQKRRQTQERRHKRREEPLTPTSAWRAAERLAEMAIMRKHMNRVSDLHGFEDARF